MKSLMLLGFLILFTATSSFAYSIQDENSILDRAPASEPQIQELKDGEKMILDNYQLVALSSRASYRVTKHGGMKTTLFGGEALVIEIVGPGTVYLQTKSIMEFVRAIIPFLPKSRH